MTTEGEAAWKSPVFVRQVRKNIKDAGAALAERRVVEAKAHQAIDGRLSSSEDKKKKGFTQLNVRVTLDLKNRVLEERARRQAENAKNADVASIVEEALLAFLARS